MIPITFLKLSDMSKIIISVPDSMGPFDLDAQILQPTKNGGVIPLFLECLPGDRVYFKVVPCHEKKSESSTR